MLNLYKVQRRLYVPLGVTLKTADYGYELLMILRINSDYFLLPH
jgi:hypothetical protein